MDLIQVASILKVNSPLHVLKEVTQYNMNSLKSKTLITTKVVLSKEYVVKGIPIKASENEIVIISNENNIVYVNVDELIALEIINPEGILDVLTDGQYFEIPTDQIPSNLEIKRLFKDAQNNFNEQYGIVLKCDFFNNKIASDKEKFQFKSFIQILRCVFIAISKDVLGNEATKNIEELDIQSSNTDFSVKKKNSQLICGINLTTSFSKDLEQKLTLLIEQKL